MPDLVTRLELFIGGRWSAPRTAHHVQVHEAATEQPIGSVAIGESADIADAVDAAGAALLGPWGSATVEDRAEILDRMADYLHTHRRETAQLVSRENGMPISLSKSVNGIGPSAMFRYYADLLRRTPLQELRPGLLESNTLIRREPVGVVAAITPWNYPQPLAAMKIAPALATGCAIVFKPAIETALDAFVFADAALHAGLPAGALNVVPGDRDAGAYLVAHPGVSKVAFTGSTQAGQSIGGVCGRLLRPVTLELGGKSAALISEDADLNEFTRHLLDVCLPNNGQTCHASTRILAPDSRFDEIVSAVTDAVRDLAVGDPLSPATAVGPLVSDRQRQRVLGYIAQGRSAGLNVTTGGGIPTAHARGWFVEPTVFADVPNHSPLAQEEIFGPVLTITRYTDEDNAIALANDSEYGLGGTIWTQDAEHGIELAARIHSGTVGVNHYSLDLNAPFGGVKNSGIGRELGPEGLSAYLVDKSVYLAAGTHPSNVLPPR